MLAAGLAPCVIYAIATHQLAWTSTLVLTLLPAVAVPVYLTLFAGHKNLRLYAGSLFMLSGLWVLLWSISPDTQGYVRDGLLGTGGFLFLLGLLLSLLFLTEGQAAGNGPGEDEDEGEAG
jgi:hypothetical protein